jgi:hypothetical protein
LAFFRLTGYEVKGKGMDFKPQTFFIGVTDFFSIVLPGAIGTYCLKVYFEEHTPPAGITELLSMPGVQGWIVFLFSSYLIGNLIFPVGGWLLDLAIYDKWLRKMFAKNSDLCYRVATAIRDEAVPVDKWVKNLKNKGKISSNEARMILKNNRREVVNTYKWAHGILTIGFPKAMTEIKKFEADSKFFRSLVIIFMLLGFGFSAEDHYLLWFIPLAVLCLFRYADLRHKATERTYEYIVAIRHLKGGLNKGER